MILSPVKSEKNRMKKQVRRLTFESEINIIGGRMSPLKTYSNAALFSLAILATLFGSTSLLHIGPSLFYDPEEFIYKWFSLPLAALILYHDRSRLAAERSAPAVGGLIALVTAGLVGFLGKHGPQLRLELLALVGQILALAWSFYGFRVAQRLLFPALAFITCLSVESFLDTGRVPGTSYVFQPFVLSFVDSVFNCCGIETLRNGLELQIPSAGLIVNGLSPDCKVAAPFAAFLLILAIASLRLNSVPRRLVLLALAFPLAVFANALRTIATISARLAGADGLAKTLCANGPATWLTLILVGGFAGIIVWQLAKGESTCAST